MHIVRSVLIGLGFVALCGIGTAEEAAPPNLRLEIASQPIGAALNEFAKQSGLQVFLSSEDGGGIIAPRISGTYTAQEALQKLLAESGLRYEYLDERTVAVRASKLDGAAPAAKPTADASSGGSTLYLAQAGDTPAGQTNGSENTQNQNNPAAVSSETEGVELEEVVVTGTHIRGAAPSGSKVIIIDRDFIERSGYGTVQDVLKTLPQNFNGGVGEDTGAADSSALNLNKGTAVNLRGLGADSTLVLVNGRRQANGGANGAFVDVSSIATSAIERIEVLTDGASGG